MDKFSSGLHKKLQEHAKIEFSCFLFAIVIEICGFLSNRESENSKIVILQGDGPLLMIKMQHIKRKGGIK
ncbi:hypothetical protein [Anoxybacteroides tepidamans]|uniref:hypothetical protein n=1 Tax=Anoxybacteroides tepidamans TaxID=265948 RepID=UPI0004840898|nr:hypothetical protein [Anoxybacillus tepidamans]